MACKIQRTANAGVLLELDGKRILLDGVCREVLNYPATPPEIKQSLTDHFPDIVAVTHFHEDHCDMDYLLAYEKATGRKAITPEYVGQTLRFGNLSLSVIASRHIGKTDCSHVSYFLRGSKCLWFMGDAAPSQWKNRTERADVLIAPFAYATTDSAWRISRQIANNTVIVHLPDRQEDSAGLGDAVRQTVGECRHVFIPELGEFIKLDFD